MTTSTKLDDYLHIIADIQ